jgi:ankyrin repeat protein
MIAAETGQSHVVKKLLAHNADPTLKDDNDNTALILASTYSHNLVVDYITEMRTQTTFAE